MHGRTYASLNWRGREAEVKLRAGGVNDRLAGADAALSPYGIRLINKRGLHVYEEWPGLDRRKVSGSIWDGRKLIWRKPAVKTIWQIPMTPLRFDKLGSGPKIRCAHRTWKSAKQLVAASREPRLFSHHGIGWAWEEDTAARDALLVLQSMALDRGAPVPLCRQQEDLTRRSSEKRSYLSERGVAYPGAAIGHGGATSQEKRRATIFNGRVNARKLREVESKQSNRWQPPWQLDNLDYWSGRSWPTGSKVPRCTGEVLRCTEGAVHTGKMQHHPAWHYVEDELGKLAAEPLWEKYVTQMRRGSPDVTMTDQPEYR